MHARVPGLARAGAVVVLGLGLLGVSATSAEAATCTYDTTARKATITVPANATGRVTIAASSQYLVVDDGFCALLADVETVSIDTSAQPAIQLAFDLSGGPLGPGFTNEGDGSSEIEFTASGMGPDTLMMIFGSSGNDHITLGTRFNVVTGLFNGQINLNASVDPTPDVDITMVTLPGTVSLNGGSGSDVLSGAGISPTGRPYSQAIHFGVDLGSDRLEGGSGPDEFIVGLLTNPGDNNFDTFIGGAGSDTALLAGSLGALRAEISLDDIANDGPVCLGTTWCQVNNVGSDIETIVGSSSSETLIGTKGPQTFVGGLGDDVWVGRGGNDLFVPEYNVQQLPRLTTMRGGKGLDTVTYAGYDQPVVVTLDGQLNDGGLGDLSDNVGKDIERVIGTPFGDGIRGSSGGDVLDGGAGDDVLEGRGGDDRLLGRAGNDTLDGGAGFDICKSGGGGGTTIKCE